MSPRVLPAPALAFAHSGHPATHSPGRRSRWLGTQVSGGSRTLTTPARKLSAAMSSTWNGEELHPVPDHVRTHESHFPSPRPPEHRHLSPQEYVGMQKVPRPHCR